MMDYTLFGESHGPVVGILLRHVPAGLPVDALQMERDLLPVLALLAAMTPQTTRFTGGAFLRRKESDRLHTVAAVLSALGAQAAELPDGLTVTGGRPLAGGVTGDAFGDHRIAMLCACAALFCRRPVTLRGGDCVAKSYEDFWRDYAALGGKAEKLEKSGG